MASVAHNQNGSPYFGGELLSFQSHAEIRLAEVEYGTEKNCPEHLHGPAFFSLLLQGRYTETLGTRRLSYRPFDLGFHPQSTTHADAIEAGPTKFFLIEVPGPWAERFPEEMGPKLCGPRASWSATRLYREHSQDNLHCPLMVEDYALEMLTAIAPKTADGEKNRPRWLARVVELLHSEFQNKLTLTQVAREVELHPVYLSRAFRRYYGEGLGQFVGRLRVQFAQKQLWDPEVPIAEVALLAGFSDQSQLTRVFKRHTGITPSAFRKIASPTAPVASHTRRRTTTWIA